MPAIRVRTTRSLGILSALLLSTAIAAPAFAQIEEVVVTAQKKTEDIQTVPISITAYSSKDLEAHQITQFKDLQFSTPNVSYTKGNFTGSDFQIRGIGITAVGNDAESGVAVHFDDVFLAAPPLAEASFYDLDRIEVLRGPQSTLYGRGATGGTVNVITAKPMLDKFAADAEATYGNYDAVELKGMVNMPIVTDQLGLRIAGDWVRHGGYVTNIADNSHIDCARPVFAPRLAALAADREDHDRPGRIVRPRRRRPHALAEAAVHLRSDGCARLPAGFAENGRHQYQLDAVDHRLEPAGARHRRRFGQSGALRHVLQHGSVRSDDGTDSRRRRFSTLNPTDMRKVNTDFAPKYKAQDSSWP